MIAPAMVATGDLFPHVCAVCGTHKGPFVNTQADTEPGHRLYLCAEVCVETFARLIGWVDPATVEGLLEDVTRLKDALADAETTAERNAADQIGMAEAIAVRAAQVALEAQQPAQAPVKAKTAAKA